MAVIYMITNRVNGKKYIGQTWDFKRRRAEHGRARRGYPLESAFRKYGRASFSWRILRKNIDNQDELNRIESALIAQHGTLVPHGYNLVALDNRGKRIGPALENQRAALRRAMSTPEWRAKNLAQLRRLHSSPEWRKKHNAAMSRNSLNPEWRRKHAAMVASISRAVCCVESGMVYRSTKEAERKTRIDASSICAAARGKRNTAGGYTWEYLDGTQKTKKPPRDYSRPSMRKPVICLTTGERFDGAVTAARAKGLNPRSINSACLGIAKTLFGQIWAYERRSE